MPPKPLSERVLSCITVALVFLLLLLSLRLLFPFYLAFLTVSCASLAAGSLKGHTKLSQKSLRLLLLGIGVFLLSCLAVLATRAVIRESEGFLNSLYETVASVVEALLSFAERLKARFDLGEILSEERLSNALSDIFSTVTTALSTRLAALATAFVKALPRVFLASIAYLLATVYIALDYENVLFGIRKLIPKRAKPILRRLKSSLLSIVRHTLRAYGILFLITFALTAAAFFLFGIDYPIWWAFLTAGLDALPAIGIGLILIPWSIGLFAAKRTLQGVLMLALYLGMTLLRQIIEPRILGRELNVPPLVSLIALYLGFKLFGGWGLLLSPVLSVLITRLASRSKDGFSRKGS